jgi:hypothetical protein
MSIFGDKKGAARRAAEAEAAQKLEEEQQELMAQAAAAEEEKRKAAEAAAAAEDERRRRAAEEELRGRGEEEEDGQTATQAKEWWECGSSSDEEEDLAPRRVTAKIISVSLPESVGCIRSSLFVEMRLTATGDSIFVSNTCGQAEQEWEEMELTGLLDYYHLGHLECMIFQAQSSPPPPKARGQEHPSFQNQEHRSLRQVSLSLSQLKRAHAHDFPDTHTHTHTHTYAHTNTHKPSRKSRRQKCCECVLLCPHLFRQGAFAARGSSCNLSFWSSRSSRGQRLFYKTGIFKPWTHTHSLSSVHIPWHTHLGRNQHKRTRARAHTHKHACMHVRACTQECMGRAHECMHACGLYTLSHARTHTAQAKTKSTIYTPILDSPANLPRDLYHWTLKRQQVSSLAVS